MQPSESKLVYTFASICAGSLSVEESFFICFYLNLSCIFFFLFTYILMIDTDIDYM